MAVELEGGCRVVGLREGAPFELEGLRVWRHVDRTTGARAISLRVLEVGPGTSPGIRNATCDEVLFVLEGRGTAFLDGHPHTVGPDTGLYLRPGVVLTLESVGPGPLTLIASQCPDPGASVAWLPPCTSPAPGTTTPAASPVVRLADRAAEVTGDRWYRVLVDDKVGSAQVTQFVGAIPPGRAPDHFHQYEEVLCILAGSGRMWAGATHAPVGPGSCVFLPQGQVHCVENTGSGELRLLGVFYPAGSPAVRYDPPPASA
jgi:mannose-6-phosphate isomerase-like protein (cupin superfamily)